MYFLINCNKSTLVFHAREACLLLNTPVLAKQSSMKMLKSQMENPKSIPTAPPMAPKTPFKSKIGYSTVKNTFVESYQTVNLADSRLLTAVESLKMTSGSKYVRFLIKTYYIK